MSDKYGVTYYSGSKREEFSIEVLNNHHLRHARNKLHAKREFLDEHDRKVIECMEAELVERGYVYDAEAQDYLLPETD